MPVGAAVFGLAAVLDLFLMLVQNARLRAGDRAVWCGDTYTGLLPDSWACTDSAR